VPIGGAYDSAGPRRSAWWGPGEPGEGQGAYIHLGCLVPLTAAVLGPMANPPDLLPPGPAIQPRQIGPPAPIPPRMFPRRLHQPPQGQPGHRRADTMLGAADQPG
jgi:hypothetical protein